MMNALLVSANVAKICLYYGGCALVILLVLIIMALMKGKTKSEMRLETIRKSCVKAKVVAEQILSDKGNVKVLAGSRLLYLKKFVANAFWYAFQIADSKKDIVCEGIANTLDALSTELVKESGNGYITEEEFEALVKRSIDTLGDIVERINGLITSK